jgi:hypothetical protein
MVARYKKQLVDFFCAFYTNGNEWAPMLWRGIANAS